MMQVLTDLGDIWLMVWLDCLTHHIYLFKSRDLAAGVVQSCISGVQPSLDSDLESAEEGNFTKRMKIDFSSCAGDLSFCPLVVDEDPRLLTCINSQLGSRYHMSLSCCSWGPESRAAATSSYAELCFCTENTLMPYSPY